MDDAGDVGSPTEALVKDAAKEYALEVSQSMMGVVFCWPTDLFVNRRRGCIPLPAHSFAASACTSHKRWISLCAPFSGIFFAAHHVSAPPYQHALTHPI